MTKSLIVMACVFLSSGWLAGRKDKRDRERERERERERVDVYPARKRQERELGFTQELRTFVAIEQ